MTDKRKSKYGAFARVERILLQDADWKRLTPLARLVLIYLLAYWKKNSLRMELPYTKAPCQGHTFASKLKELIREEWIKVNINDHGALLGHKATKYMLGPKGAKWWPEIFHSQ